jgi:hypothetical protein
MTLVGLIDRDFIVFMPVLNRYCQFVLLLVSDDGLNWETQKLYEINVDLGRYVWLPQSLKCCIGFGLTFLHLVQILIPASFKYRVPFNLRIKVFWDVKLCCSVSGF